MREGCDFRQVLARHGLRPTVRLAVLEALAVTPRALKAREILDLIRTRRRVNKVTVYRVLKDLAHRGLLRQVPSQGRACHYELACEHHPPHPHFQCHSCGEVTCLAPVSLEEVWRQLEGPLGNQAERLDLRVVGLCRKCRELG